MFPFLTGIIRWSDIPRYRELKRRKAELEFDLSALGPVGHQNNHPTGVRMIQDRQKELHSVNSELMQLRTKPYR